MMIMLNVMSLQDWTARDHRLSPTSDNAENRTTFRGVSSDVAESPSEDVVAVSEDEVEFFLLGSRSFDILICSRVEKCAIDEPVLFAERGVDGVVEVVREDKDTLESDGVAGTDCGTFGF